MADEFPWIRVFALFSPRDSSVTIFEVKEVRTEIEISFRVLPSVPSLHSLKLTSERHTFVLLIRSRWRYWIVR